MSINIIILGHGEIGHAMEFLLKNHQSLAIWDKYPPANLAPIKLEDSIPRADAVMFCLPVNPHREIIHRIKPYLQKHCLCISVAKGLDETGKTAAQIFSESLPPSCPYALLYGPMIAEEILAGNYAFAQLGCRDPATFKMIQACFADTKLYLEHTDDIEGISWSVILKNVYAMVFGIADELKLGANVRGYLVTAALQELQQIVMRMGGHPDSPYRLSGLGDLITTATSENSHHHALGRKIARGEINDISGEGPHTLKMIKQHQLFPIKDYALLALIHAVLSRPVDIRSQFTNYLQYRNR